MNAKRTNNQLINNTPIEHTNRIATTAAAPANPQEVKGPEPPEHCALLWQQPLQTRGREHTTQRSNTRKKTKSNAQRHRTQRSGTKLCHVLSYGIGPLAMPPAPAKLNRTEPHPPRRPPKPFAPNRTAPIHAPRVPSRHSKPAQSLLFFAAVHQVVSFVGGPRVALSMVSVAFWSPELFESVAGRRGTNMSASMSASLRLSQSPRHPRMREAVINIWVSRHQHDKPRISPPRNLGDVTKSSNTIACYQELGVEAPA